MKKRLLSVLLCAAMVMGSLAGCGSKTTAETSAGTSGETTTQAEQTGDTGAAEGEKKTLKIGMAWAILDDGQTNLTNGIKACFENAFPDYTIESTLTNADGDISKLIDDVESLIAKDPDVIFIMNSVGGDGIVPAINVCAEAGIPVGIGSAIEGEAPYTYPVSYTHLDVYKRQVPAACGETGGRGNPDLGADRGSRPERTGRGNCLWGEF